MASINLSELLPETILADIIKSLSLAQTEGLFSSNSIFQETLLDTTARMSGKEEKAVYIVSYVSFDIINGMEVITSLDKLKEEAKDSYNALMAGGDWNDPDFGQKVDDSVTGSEVLTLYFNAATNITDLEREYNEGAWSGSAIIYSNFNVETFP